MTNKTALSWYLAYFQREAIGFDVVLACGVCCDTSGQVVTGRELISGAITALTQKVQHYK